MDLLLLLTGMFILIGVASYHYNNNNNNNNKDDDNNNKEDNDIGTTCQQDEFWQTSQETGQLETKAKEVPDGKTPQQRLERKLDKRSPFLSGSVLEPKNASRSTFSRLSRHQRHHHHHHHLLHHHHHRHLLHRHHHHHRHHLLHHHHHRHRFRHQRNKINEHALPTCSKEATDERDNQLCHHYRSHHHHLRRRRRRRRDHEFQSAQQNNNVQRPKTKASQRKQQQQQQHERPSNKQRHQRTSTNPFSGSYRSTAGSDVGYNDDKSDWPDVQNINRNNDDDVVETFIHSSFDRSHRRDYSRYSFNSDYHMSDASDACPVVDASSTLSNSCWCTANKDIRCQELYQIPKFLPNQRVFGGFYAESQRVSALPQSSFANLKVRKIVFNFNPLGERLSVDALRDVGQNLQELYLGGCGLTQLPQTFLGNLENLLRLHLWGNKITAIPKGFFKKSPRLRELVLWGNQIEEIDSETFAGLWALRRLDLDRNNISKLDKEAFRHLAELQVLYLGENRIEVLQGDTFSYMENLKVLNLDGNGLHHIFQLAFGNLNSLVVLDLSSNNIDFFPSEVFFELRNVTEVRLDRNRLAYLWGSTFAGLDSLSRIYLAHNNMTSIPEGLFRSLPKLRHISLRGNLITSLKRGSSYKRLRLKTLDLSANPLNCDCNLLWLAELVPPTGDASTKVLGSCQFLEEAEISMSEGDDDAEDPPNGSSDGSDSSRAGGLVSVSTYTEGLKLARACEGGWKGS